MTEETREVRRKRLRIRAWRRGIKEMDLILGGYADQHLSELNDSELDALEAVMAENDHDLLQWVTGQEKAPPEFEAVISDLRKSALR